jgi:hypothetical protein
VQGERADVGASEDRRLTRLCGDSYGRKAKRPSPSSTRGPAEPRGEPIRLRSVALTLCFVFHVFSGASFSGPYRDRAALAIL